MDGDGKWSIPPIECSPDASVWPVELQNNDYFFRLGNGNIDDNNSGDFFTLRKMNATHSDNAGDYPVRDVLIKSYQYAIAKFDCDGFRIDTLKYIPNDFAHTFGNAIRDNHDQPNRFYSPGFEEQLKTGIGALITLQGISCIYYGTYQDLFGSGGMDNIRVLSSPRIIQL